MRTFCKLHFKRLILTVISKAIKQHYKHNYYKNVALDRKLKANQKIREMGNSVIFKFYLNGLLFTVNLKNFFIYIEEKLTEKWF